MGVVVTCNGQLVLFVEEGFLGPNFLEVEPTQFLKPLSARVDFNLVIQNIFGSELLSHAGELSQELALESLEYLLEEVGELLVAVNLAGLECDAMPLGRNVPGLDERNVGIKFLGEFEVYEEGDTFEDPVFFEEFVFDAVLLLFDQLKVEFFRVLFVPVHFFNPGLHSPNPLIELLMRAVATLQNELAHYATYPYRLFLRFHYFKFLFPNTM